MPLNEADSSSPRHSLLRTQAPQPLSSQGTDSAGNPLPSRAQTSQPNTCPSPGDHQGQDQHLQHPHQELSRKLEVTNFLKAQQELGLQQAVQTSLLLRSLQSSKHYFIEHTGRKVRVGSPGFAGRLGFCAPITSVALSGLLDLSGFSHL